MKFTHLIVLIFMTGDGSAHARLQSVASIERCHELGSEFLKAPDVKPDVDPRVGRAYTCNSINTNVPELHKAIIAGLSASGRHNQETIK